MTDEPFRPYAVGDPVENLTRRHVLTDQGRHALGLPPIGDVALVPVYDLPWYRDVDRRIAPPPKGPEPGTVEAFLEGARRVGEAVRAHGVSMTDEEPNRG